MHAAELSLGQRRLESRSPLSPVEWVTERQVNKTKSEESSSNEFQIENPKVMVPRKSQHLRKRGNYGPLY